MSIRKNVLALVDVLIRVPLLYGIDQNIKTTIGLSPSYNLDLTLESLFDVYPIVKNYIIKIIPQDRVWDTLTNCAMCVEVVRICVLSKQQVGKRYLFIVSAMLMMFSYEENVRDLHDIENSPQILEDILSLNISRLLTPGGMPVDILVPLVFQLFFGMVFALIHIGPRVNILQNLLPFCFPMPLLLVMLPLPTAVLKHIPLFSAVLPFVLVVISFYTITINNFNSISSVFSVAENIEETYYPPALLEKEWQRLNIPCVLGTFWIIRFALDLIKELTTNDMPVTILTVLQDLLVRGCATPLGVLGMASIISVICFYFGKIFQIIILPLDYHDYKSGARASGIIFLILALQTGLTSQSSVNRFACLCMNLSLVVTALFRFLYYIISPMSILLSAARSQSRKRHICTLSGFMLLLLAQIILLAIIWSKFKPSTLLLAATAFSLEVIVKVLVSLTIYALFLFDAKSLTFSEKVDDYIYYIRAFGNSIEFCCGIFLFGNGAWILIYESGCITGAIMMIAHTYCNIWCTALLGWSIFIKRRKSVQKISSLPDATAEQLAILEDVCAICFQEMASAKITWCLHIFHEVCLRKWFCFQDTCPICRVKISRHQHKQ